MADSNRAEGARILGFSKQWCLGLIPFCCASTAFVCSMMFSFWCDSIQFSHTGETSDLIDTQLLESVRLGPWSWKQTEYVPAGIGHFSLQDRVFVRERCVNLPAELDIDSKWKAVRAFSIIVPVVGGLLAFVILLANCTYILSDPLWKCIALLFLVGLTLFQGLEFLLLQSNACSSNPLLYDNAAGGISNSNWVDAVNTVYETDCEWAVGSTVNVISIVFWFLAGISMLWLGAPKRPPPRPVETQTVTYERTVQPDGTTAVVETAVVKGVAVQ